MHTKIRGQSLKKKQTKLKNRTQKASVVQQSFGNKLCVHFVHPESRSGFDFPLRVLSSVKEL